MIKIMSINKAKLMNQIAKCSGSVYLHFDDGTFCDIKNDVLGKKMLRLLELPKDGITLSVSDPNDFVGFFRYMMEVSLSDS